MPVVEIAPQADAACARCPDREGDAIDIAESARVCSEDVIESPMAALAGQMEIEIADGRQEPVRITLGPGMLTFGDLEIVGEMGLPTGNRPREDSCRVKL